MFKSRYTKELERQRDFLQEQLKLAAARIEYLEGKVIELARPIVAQPQAPPAPRSTPTVPMQKEFAPHATSWVRTIPMLEDPGAKVREPETTAKEKSA